jgi:hypothetical protein
VTYLPDVNVLIALVDPAHVAHDAAHAWFAATGSAGWATCPTTENGLLRIVGHPRYPNSAGSPAAVAPVLAGLRGHPGHQFWPDAISLMQTDGVDPARILTSGQMTDTYLLALAKARAGVLATFDRRLSVAAVTGGAAALHVIAGA